MAKKHSIQIGSKDIEEYDYDPVKERTVGESIERLPDDLGRGWDRIREGIRGGLKSIGAQTDAEKHIELGKKQAEDRKIQERSKLSMTQAVPGIGSPPMPGEFDEDDTEAKKKALISFRKTRAGGAVGGSK